MPVWVGQLTVLWVVTAAARISVQTITAAIIGVQIIGAPTHSVLTWVATTLGHRMETPATKEVTEEWPVEAILAAALQAAEAPAQATQEEVVQEIYPMLSLNLHLVDIIQMIKQVA